MKTLLRFEEAVLFLGGIYLFSRLPYPWWVFPALILLPDLSMVGYVVNTKLGAVIYNIFHTRIIGIGAMLLGWHFDIHLVALAGVILFSHSALDRVLQYGLKYHDSFKHTHLGMLR